MYKAPFSLSHLYKILTMICQIYIFLYFIYYIIYIFYKTLVLQDFTDFHTRKRQESALWIHARLLSAPVGMRGRER